MGYNSGPAAWAASLLCAFVASSDIFAGPVAPSTASQPPGPAGQWPVLHDRSGRPVGLYGGIATAYSEQGERQSVALLILPSGYVAPVSVGTGSLAGFPTAFFDQPQCSGREHLAPAGEGDALLPFPGVVYRSIVSGRTAYIPKDRSPVRVQIRSRLSLHATGTRCDPQDRPAFLLLSEDRAGSSTGIGAGGEFGPLVIAVETATHPASRRDRGVAAGVPARPMLDAIGNDAAREECSPGCLLEAVGNGYCDVDCYSEACSYDRSDCAAMPKSELEAALSRVCAPGCNRADVGDGFCDGACLNPACDQDGGDCDRRSE